MDVSVMPDHELKSGGFLVGKLKPLRYYWNLIGCQRFVSRKANPPVSMIHSRGWLPAIM
jgi:hypothetical protein